MEILNSIISIIVVFIAIIILDFVWLGIIMKDFIISEFASLVKVENGSININLVVGILTWFIIALSCFIFAINPSNSLKQSMFLGALFGFSVYSIYDLTNLTFIVNYPIKFIFVDIAWGTFLCSFISGLGFFVKSII